MGFTSMRPVNTVATYTCVTGYTLNASATRTCQDNGLWSGSVINPTCDGEYVMLNFEPVTISNISFPVLVAARFFHVHTYSHHIL